MDIETVGSGNPELKSGENVFYGVVGALLLNLVGGLATVLLLQTNIIAGIAGMIGIMLGYWGYKKFAKVEYSVKGLVISIVLAIIVQIAAYYLGLALQIYRDFDRTLTFGRVLELLPIEYRENPEFKSAVLGDLIKLLIFMAIASVYVVMNTFRQIKAIKEQNRNGSVVYRDEDCDADH